MSEDEVDRRRAELWRAYAIDQTMPEQTYRRAMDALPRKDPPLFTADGIGFIIMIAGVMLLFTILHLAGL